MEHPTTPPFWKTAFGIGATLVAVAASIYLYLVGPGGQQATILQQIMNDAQAGCWAPDPPSDGPCQVK